MSKILVIPDIHCRNFWRITVSNNIGKVDKVIFLGDYLDPYADEIDENPESMECKSFYDVQSNLAMLSDILSLKKNEPNKYILLCGNHTCSYIWSKFSAATRTDYRNWELHHKFFSENLEYFNLVWIENDVIFSHAGITKDWANEFWEILGFPENEICTIKEVAEVLKDTPLKNFNIHYIKAISEISHIRRGESQFGSCEWADIREHIDFSRTQEKHKIIPIDDDNSGVFQIFGHNQVKKPIITDKWACLDCRQGFIIDTITHEINKC